MWMRPCPGAILLVGVPWPRPGWATMLKAVCTAPCFSCWFCHIKLSLYNRLCHYACFLKACKWNCTIHLRCGLLCYIMILQRFTHVAVWMFWFIPIYYCVALQNKQSMCSYTSYWCLTFELLQFAFMKIHLQTLWNSVSRGFLTFFMIWTSPLAVW